MTNEELEEVIEYNEWMLRATLNDTRMLIKNHQLYPNTPYGLLFLKMQAEETIKNGEMGLKLIEAARELLQIKDGTHPDMVMVPREVVNFLNGTGELEGVCFGEKNGYHNGNFWWRKYLGAAARKEWNNTK